MASKLKLRRQELLPPFSEDDHGNYLTKIHERLYDIKEEMRATIEGNLMLYMETLDHTTQLSQQVGRVSQELDNIRSRVRDPENSLFAVVINTTKRRRALADSERHTGVLIKVLESLVHVKNELDTLHTFIQQRKLVSSIKQRVLVSNLISSLPGAYTAGNEPIIYGAIKQRFSKLSQDLVELLQGAYSTSFRIDPKNSSFTLTTSTYEAANSLEADEIGHHSSLCAILAMLHAVELGHPSIDALAALLLPFIDLFLIEPSKTVPFPVLDTSTSVNEVHLTVRASKGPNNRFLDIAVSLGSTVAFFQFLTDNIILPLQHEFVQLQAIINPDVSSESSKASAFGLCERLGSALLPYMVERLVLRCFEPSIPEHRSELERYQKDVELQMAQFVPLLSDFSWLPSKDLSHHEAPLSVSASAEVWNSKLIDFLKSAHLHFGNKKKHLVLGKVRTLLLSGQYTSSVIGELEFGATETNQSDSSDTPIAASIFKFPECRVRDVIIELVGIAEELMADAFYNSDEKNPRSFGAPISPGELHLRTLLLETVKDIFDLYRSIIPSYEQTKIAHIPQLSMLFHNDCQYMAHRITLMAARYRLHFVQSKQDSTPPSPVISAASSSAPPQSHHATATSSRSSGSHNLRKATATALPIENGAQNFSFVDLITALRSMAEKFYNDINAALRDQLEVLLENTERLKGTQHEEKKKRCLIVMRHIVTELENKDRMWSDTLPRELHKVTMGQLVNEVTEWMILTALEASDFTADETESLHLIFLAIFPLAKIFVDVYDTTTTDGANPHPTHAKNERQASITKSSCARYVKSWLRFEELADAFKMPMIEIVERFNAGELHFTRHEIQRLIEACFEASTKRTQRIASLRMDVPVDQS